MSTFVDSTHQTQTTPVSPPFLHPLSSQVNKKKLYLEKCIPAHHPYFTETMLSRTTQRQPPYESMHRPQSPSWYSGAPPEPTTNMRGGHERAALRLQTPTPVPARDRALHHTRDQGGNSVLGENNTFTKHGKIETMTSGMQSPLLSHLI